MSYEEKRVLVEDYGVLPSGSSLLVSVPGTGGKACTLHTLAAQAFMRLAAAVKRDLDIELEVATGWQPQRWGSKEQYEEFLTQKYGSVLEGQKWLPFSSPYETGLAMDLGSGGLTPSRKTRSRQRETPLHRWLVEHAWEYGWHPYKVEPWRWEYPVSKHEWETGQRDADREPGHDD